MRRLFVAILLFGSCGCVFAASRAISYTIRVSDPVDGRFHVQASFASGPGHLRVFMPAFTPGSLLQNNARYVSNIHGSTVSGRVVPIERVTKDEWEVVSRAAEQLTISYDVVPNSTDSLRLTTNFLGTHGGFFQGTTVLLGVRGRLHDSATLKLELPAGWKIATNLVGERSTYHAPDYAALVLAPVQFGDWTERDISTHGVNVRLVFDAPLPPYDEAKLDEKIAKIVDHHIRLFGSAPFHDFLVLFHWRPDLSFGGGVARRSAMVMNIGKEWMSDLPAKLGETFAHEMFHAWNFASFYPRPVPPTDYLQPEYTTSAWFVEGVTDYYVMRTFAEIGQSSRARLMSWIS